MLMTPPPCIEEYLYTRHPKAAYGGHTPADRLLEAGAIVKKLAAEFNAPCVDVHAVIGTDPANLIRTVANCGQPDGVHLLPAGYRAIAEAVFAKFRELGIRPASVACLGDSLTFGHPRVEGRHAGEWDLPGCVVRKTHAPFIGLGDFVLQFFYNYFAFS